MLLHLIYRQHPSLSNCSRCSGHYVAATLIAGGRAGAGPLFDPDCARRIGGSNGRGLARYCIAEMAAEPWRTPAGATRVHGPDTAFGHPRRTAQIQARAAGTGKLTWDPQRQRYVETVG